MHSSCTHLRTFSRIALASAGISKSIDMAAVSSCWFIVAGFMIGSACSMAYIRQAPAATANNV
jgi:hypothetical protein